MLTYGIGLPTMCAGLPVPAGMHGSPSTHPINRPTTHGSGTGMSYGSGRVRVRSPWVRVYPFLSVKNAIFTMLEIYRKFFCFFLLKILLTI